MSKNIIFLILVFCTFGFLNAQPREEKLDFVFIIDVSSSMEGKVEPLKEYLLNIIGAERLIIGDSVTLIQFYGKAEIFDQSRIETEEDKKELENKILSIKADGRFTDIGNALDFLLLTVPTLSENNNRRIFILLTDGIQEAPPHSPYATLDNSFNHELLDTAEKIKQEGWFIYVLGLGEESQAKEIAQEIGASFQIFENPQDLPQGGIDLGLVLNWEKAPVLNLESDQPILTLFFDASGFHSPRSLEIESIDLKNDTGLASALQALSSPSIYQISSGGSHQWDIPLQNSFNIESLKEGQWIPTFIWSSPHQISGTSQPIEIHLPPLPMVEEEVIPSVKYEDRSFFGLDPGAFWIFVGILFTFILLIVFLIAKGRYFSYKKMD